MSKFLVKTLSETGIIEVASDALGKGGEGAVYSVNSHNLKNLQNANDLVFKKYYEPEENDRYPKLVSMIKNSPNNDNLAWPLALVYDQNKKFQGYLMKKLDFKTYRPWADFAHTRERKKITTDFDLRYAFTSILNFAKAVESVNNIGFFIGDLNESNAFVSTSAMVFLVDLDAGQITDSKGKTYVCSVGKPEYTAPEISYGALKDNPRTKATEVFALSIASWMMLTGGTHPTDGIFKGKGDPPIAIEKIRQGIYPALLNNKGYDIPKRVPIEGIPTRIKKLFISTFSIEPEKRLTIEQFIKVFENVNNNLVQCSKVKEHWYDKRDGKCGWCEHVEKGGLDTWNVKPPVSTVPVSNQIALPSLNFDNSENNKPVRSQRTPPPSQQNNTPIQQSAGVLNNIPQNQGNTSVSSNPVQNFSNNQNYSQQQQQNFNTPQQQFQPTQQPQQEKPQNNIPEKIKGKTVLQYNDGTWGVRPSISSLMSKNPKVAIHCIKNETPGFLKIWWDNKLPVMDKIYGIIGYVLSFIVSLSWYITVPMLKNIIPAGTIWTLMNDYNIWHILSIISVITALTASTYLLLSGFNDRRKFFKAQGRTAIPKVLSIFKTLLKFVLVSIFYGPLFIISVIIFILVSLINALLSQVRI